MFVVRMNEWKGERALPDLSLLHLGSQSDGGWWPSRGNLRRERVVLDISRGKRMGRGLAAIQCMPGSA